jgi:hypothetical protein
MDEAANLTGIEQMTNTSRGVKVLHDGVYLVNYFMTIAQYQEWSTNDNQMGCRVKVNNHVVLTESMFSHDIDYDPYGTSGVVPLYLEKDDVVTVEGAGTNPNRDSNAKLRLDRLGVRIAQVSGVKPDGLPAPSSPNATRVSTARSDLTRKMKFPHAKTSARLDPQRDLQEIAETLDKRMPYYGMMTNSRHDTKGLKGSTTDSIFKGRGWRDATPRNMKNARPMSVSSSGMLIPESGSQWLVCAEMQAFYNHSGGISNRRYGIVEPYGVNAGSTLGHFELSGIDINHVVGARITGGTKGKRISVAGGFKIATGSDKNSQIGPVTVWVVQL